MKGIKVIHKVNCSTDPDSSLEVTTYKDLGDNVDIDIKMDLGCPIHFVTLTPVQQKELAIKLLNNLGLYALLYKIGDVDDNI